MIETERLLTENIHDKKL